MSNFLYQPTNYGFKWGPCEVTRAASCRKVGVFLDIETPKRLLQLRVTPTGNIRVSSVYSKGKPRKHE
jgi:hypothetical protein